MNRHPIWAQAVMLVFLIALGVGGRLASREFTTWNFTPLAAVTLLGGFYLGSVFVAAIVPVAVMTISNLVLYPNQPWLGYGYWQMMAVVYAALLLPLLFRWLLRSRRTTLGLLLTAFLSAIASSLLFFFVTNLAHWYFQVTPHTQETFVRNYIDAVPFYRGTLAGDVLFSMILFCGYTLAAHFGATAETPATAPVRR